MANIKLTADLDRLIKRAAEVKTAALKVAEDVSSKIDKKEDGTSPASTGSHAAANKADAASITAGAVDGGAKTNPVNGSVTNNTDGSEAGATDGSKGPAAGEFPVKSEADNGPTKGEGKFASVRKLANELRAAADSMLTNFDKFLVKAARASDDKNVKTAADGMADDDVSAQASDALMEQIAAGQVTDEDATQILQEAVAAGAISPDELQEAAALADQAGGAEGGAEAAPEVAPEAAVEEAPVAAPEVTEGAPLPMEDQAKLAAAMITPEHPKYLDKLAAVNDDDMNAGYAFFNKLAEVLVKEAEEVPADKQEVSEKEGDEAGETKAHEAGETPKEEKAEESAAGVVDAMSGVNLAPTDDAEKQALAAVKAELGINDEQLAELSKTPVPATTDKVAAAKAMYRTAIMAKVASLKN